MNSPGLIYKLSDKHYQYLYAGYDRCVRSEKTDTPCSAETLNEFAAHQERMAARAAELAAYEASKPKKQPRPPSVSLGSGGSSSNSPTMVEFSVTSTSDGSGITSAFSWGATPSNATTVKNPGGSTTTTYSYWI